MRWVTGSSKLEARSGSNFQLSFTCGLVDFPDEAVFCLAKKETASETQKPLVESSEAQVTNTFTGTALNTFAGIQENQDLDRLALFVPGVVNTRQKQLFQYQWRRWIFSRRHTRPQQ